MKKLMLLFNFILLSQIISAQWIDFIFDQQYFSSPILNGAYCPNSQDDQIGTGGHDFSGGMRFDQNHTFRIEVTPNSSALFLDVDFRFGGTTNPAVSVRGKRSLKLYELNSSEFSIVGFRQTKATVAGYTQWYATNSAFTTWTDSGDGGIFCEDDNRPDIRIPSGGGINDLFFNMALQGDTGGDDISTDRDCSCDTRVMKIYWSKNIQVAIGHDIDRDGIQDKRAFKDLPVDKGVNVERDIVKLCAELDGKKITGNIHNNDCRKIHGAISVSFGKKSSNFSYPRISNSSNLIDWRNGNSDRDFIVRDLNSVQSTKVCYEVPKADIDNSKVVMRVAANGLKGCHKGCDLCTDYRCNVRYINAASISLSSFTHQNGAYQKSFVSQLGPNPLDQNAHYLRVPIKVSY